MTNVQNIEVGDRVLFARTNAAYQVREVHDYGFTLCGFQGIVQEHELTLLSKAGPRDTEFDGMTDVQIRAIIRQRVEASAQRAYEKYGV